MKGPVWASMNFFSSITESSNGGILEHPCRLGLEPFTNQGMKPVACGEMHFDVSTFFQQAFGCDQIQHVEPSALFVVQETGDCRPPYGPCCDPLNGTRKALSLP